MAQWDLYLTQNILPSDIQFKETILPVTKGFLITANSNKSIVSLPLGNDGQILISDPSQESGLRWVTTTGNHTQNTDTGTTSQTFLIDSGSVLGRMSLYTTHGTGNFGIGITHQALTADQVISFPNASGVVSLTSHNHNTLYAPLVHSHDALYALLGHNHDGLYEPVISAKGTAFNKNYGAVVSDVKMNGSASVGVIDAIARIDHIHPIDTGRQAHTVGLDNLSNLSAVGTPGIPKITGANTWVLDTNTYLSTTGTAADSSKLGGQLPTYYATAAQINATNLNTNSLIKWDGSKFANSIATDDGATITVGGTVVANTVKLTVGATIGYVWTCTSVGGAGTWQVIPTGSSVYKGTWSANGTTGTPALTDGTGNIGDYYRCIVGGTADFGSGSVTVAAGDDLRYNGLVWQVIPSSSYTLVTASSTVLGGIKVGNSLYINGSSILDIKDGSKTDITVSGSGLVWTINNNVVTLAKLQQINTSTILGRITASTGNVELLTIANVQSMLGLGTAAYQPVGSFQTAHAGLTALTVLTQAGTAGIPKISGTNTWTLDTNTYATISSLTTNYHTMWSGTSLVNSNIRQDGTNIIIDSRGINIANANWIQFAGTNVLYSNGTTTTIQSGDSGDIVFRNHLNSERLRILNSGGIEVGYAGASFPGRLLGYAIAANGNVFADLDFITTSHHSSVEWDQAYLWGNHATQGYVTGGPYQASSPRLDNLVSLGTTAGFLKVVNGTTWSIDTNSYSLTSHTHAGVHQPVGNYALWVSVPANSSSAGTVGSIATDGDFFYVCYASGDWRRAVMSTGW